VVYGDQLRLGQVVRNLISNAVKYSPEGSEILLRVCTRDGNALLSVTDFGPGIPAEHLEKIFEPFHRISGANPEWEIEGIGLGLYICKDIVQRHDGKIWVESALGQGSTFFVELPLEKS
jgi:signal transduction histidine kinase